MTDAVIQENVVRVHEISWDGFLSDKQEEILTGLSRPTRWRLEQAGQYPRRVQIAANRVGRLASEIKEWMNSRPRVPLEVGKVGDRK